MRRNAFFIKQTTGLVKSSRQSCTKDRTLSFCKAHHRLININMTNVNLESLSIAQSIEAEGSNELADMMAGFKVT